MLVSKSRGRVIVHVLPQSGDLWSRIASHLEGTIDDCRNQDTSPHAAFCEDPAFRP